MSTYFGYIRVSTAKQGERGVSLQEQRDGIQRYASSHGLTVSQWFEERETAAKRGRRIFNQMLRALRERKARGVIIHKIDRSARNLRDWADLVDLNDQGIEVHMANEGLDLHSRGGRLSADIQAVVAADYIRNLREETRKGFYGRLKQGLYPLGAPLGYLDKGKGQVKIPDPETAPFVRRAFELYATGRYSLDTLRSELHRSGLRNRRGNLLSLNGLSTILNNPFYIGIIRLRRSGETFAGIHKPLISKSLFDRVHDVLTGKLNTRTIRHDFLFRRLITCADCGFALIGELQKRRVYYRCHTKGCLVTCVREDAVEAYLLNILAPLELSQEELEYAKAELTALKQDLITSQASRVNAIRLQLAQIDERLHRLTDAYIDGVIERDIFEHRKADLLLERKSTEEAQARLAADPNLVMVPADPDRLFRSVPITRSVSS
jgi:DNA invertase Pin-like site-specific DNA recombinase